MAPNVRVDWHGTTLRLFPHKTAAQQAAQLLAPQDAQRHDVLEHPSQCGWILRDRHTGHWIDVAGQVVARGERLPAKGVAAP